MCFMWTSIINISEDLEHNPLLVMLGAGMAATVLIGPYFFYRPVNTTSYAEMLEVWLIM